MSDKTSGIAVTTASGQLGQATIRALQAMDTGSQIVGLARTPANAQDLGVTIRPGDYDVPDQLVTGLAGVDAVLMISGKSDPSARVQQHRHVIAAAKSAGVRKIVFTSVQGIEGAPKGSVGASFLQTEADVKASGLDWCIGRNGVYIEPDLEYVGTYAKLGEIANSAQDGRCGYTTRSELGAAYAHLLTDDRHTAHTYSLNGTPMTQAVLARYFSLAFGLSLTYRPMSAEAYMEDRQAALGPEMGAIIAGIYDSIREGVFEQPSDFATVVGRPHMSWDAYFAAARRTFRTGAT